MGKYSRIVISLLAIIIVFGGMVGFFAAGLERDPKFIPSVLINQPLPDFELDPLPGRNQPLSKDTIAGEVSLLNVFGSWCVGCIQEHGQLLKIRKEGLVKIHGIDWREKNPADGVRWLKRNGDPYDLVGLDPDSKLAIDLGVTGAPETYIIDKAGVVRYKHTGPIEADADHWGKILRPIVLKLQDEPDPGVRP